MKKVLAYLAFICLALLLFTSCSPAQKTGSSAITSQNTPVSADNADIAQKSATSKPERPLDNGISLPGASTATTIQNTPISSNSAGTAQKSVASEPEKTIDSGLTLAGIKKATQDAGYQVEEVQDMQINKEPKPAAGFNVIYKDENIEAQIPVFEFQNAADALAFAKQVNETGYNLCIINGKFLTMTDARYGLVLNNKEQAVLEALLNSKVMVYAELTPAPANYSKDYAGTCLQITAICTALDKLVNRSVILYDKALLNDDPKKLEDISFSLLASGDLAFTAIMSEDQAKLDSVVKVWKMFGCTDVKLRHDKAHDYVLTGKRAGLTTSFEIHCAYSPEKGSLLLVDKDEGEVKELYEFIPLGGDKYAFQTLFERGIVEYIDGNIISVIYSLNKRDKALAYDLKKDGIYPNGQGTGEAWVSKNGEDSYEQFISFKENKLKVAATNFIGERVKTEINAN